MALINRFITVAQGGMALIGNTLNCTQNQTYPPASQDYLNGAYISTNTSLVALPGFPQGTTMNPLQASSTAVLEMPEGSTVLFAQLFWTMWGIPIVFDTPITLQTPKATVAVAPDPTLTLNQNLLLWQAQDVKDIVQTGGSGIYTVGNVPGTAITNGSSVSCNAWGMIVVYENNKLPRRYFNINTGLYRVSAGTPSDFNFVFFATPVSGPLDGYFLLSQARGDLNDAALLFVGPTQATSQQMGNPSNPWNGQAPYAYMQNLLPGNVLIADINNPQIGLLDTRGTFGTFNKNPFARTAPMFARNNFDIFGIDISSTLYRGQTTLFTRDTFAGVGFAEITSQSVVVKINSPLMIPAEKSVNTASTRVGKILTYTIKFTNTGSANADNFTIFDTIPNGTVFVADSVTVDDVPRSGANPQNGVNFNTVVPGQRVVMTFKVTVTQMPVPNPIPNQARATYTYIPQAGVAPQPGTVETNEVTTLVYTEGRGISFI